MSSLLEMIKQNAVPAAVMRSASRGALPVAAEEMLEILVYLTQNPVFGQDARMTLAGWDISSALTVAANSQTAPEVLAYFWAEQNRRPALMRALIENPAISDMLLMEVAGEARREIVNMLLASKRVRNAPAIIEALATNPNVSPDELRQLRGEASPAPETAPASETAPSPVPETSPSPAPEAAPESPIAADPESEAQHEAFRQEHAAEIAAEEGKPFQLVDTDTDAGAEKSAAAMAADPPQPAAEPLAQPASPARKNPAADPRRLTMLQKLGRMSAADRVKTAFTGGREERAVLIRDGARIVQNAVLSSPKLTEPEVEVFAAAKNVHDNVLREIARNRRFMKNYSVMRNLVQNPKTPVDISLPLVKMLMVYDLKALQRSKNVSETIRALAAKYYREKSTSGGKTKD